MDVKQFIESGILETYAMGLASEQDAKLVAEMVARYPEVKAELTAIEISMEEFDRQNAVTPPAHLKEKILAKVFTASTGSDNGKPEAKVVSIAPLQKQIVRLRWVAAILFVLACGGSWKYLGLRDKMDEKEAQIQELNSKVASMDTLTKTLGSEKEILLAQIDMFKHPGMKSIELKGMADVAPDAKAMAYANTATGEVYLEIMNLPAAPEGMQYQFWGIVDGKPVDAGMIPLTGDTTGIHPMTTVPDAVAYAISLEPQGGSHQPQGKIFVMGNI